MYRVCKDGVIVEIFDSERKAKAFLRKMKLGPFENGYLDECDEKGEHILSLYQKLKTSGSLLECW